MKIEKIFNLSDFKSTIPFTALGARTCYSSGDLNYLLNDPRVVSKDERAKFLSKLGNYKHFSVFAHSFAYKDLSKIEEEVIDELLGDKFKSLTHKEKAEILANKIGSTFFKSHYNPKYPTVIGISLRHYLERLLNIGEEIYFNTFEKMADYDIPIEPAGKIENVTLIGILKEYDGYGVFYIDNVSRTMTHQLVRHTALNYSQRSQRYVREDENESVIPPSISSSELKINHGDLTDTYLKLIKIFKEYLEKSEGKEKLVDEFLSKVNELETVFRSKKEINMKDIFILSDHLSQAIYNFFVYYGKIKREDARFILPHGRKTTIVVSGTISWLKDFIIKRTDPHAQWEIRDVAEKMKNLLEKEGITF
ncbi:FAD-dependent thymidylate synthase [Persephonella sp.]